MSIDGHVVDTPATELGSDPWMAYVPMAFRALANPANVAEWPQPRCDTLANANACASWGALHYLLIRVLGWSDIGRGLAAWYASDKPIADSPVLALVASLWERNDLLDDYAAWAWRMKQPHALVRDAQRCMSCTDDALLAFTYPRNDWWQAFKRRGAVHLYDPFNGWSDSLHLAIHPGDDPGLPSDSAILHFDASLRQALLRTHLEHWLADLRVAESRLPCVGNRSWHVEVFTRQYGYLGKYRKSRVTGRWFQGKHSIHLMGSPHE